MAATKKTNTKTGSARAKKTSAAKKSAISVKPPRAKKAAEKRPVPKNRPKTAKSTPKVVHFRRRSAALKSKSTKKTAAITPVSKPHPLRPKKTPSYSKTDLNHFREIILDKIREANEELQSIEERLLDVTSGEYTDEDATYSMHMAEQGTDAMEREKAFLFASRERKFISHLEDAMQRIASGIYGVCISCGNLIDKGRLEAVPHARMCVNCKNDSKKTGETFAQ